jgi:hypothetical protein
MSIRIPGIGTSDKLSAFAFSLIRKRSFAATMVKFWSGEGLQTIVRILNDNLHKPHYFSTPQSLFGHKEISLLTNNNAIVIKRMVALVFPESLSKRNQNKEKFALERFMYCFNLLANIPEGVDWLKSKNLSDQSIICLNSSILNTDGTTLIKRKTLNDITELFAIYAYFPNVESFRKEAVVNKNVCASVSHSKERKRFAVSAGLILPREVIEIIFKSSVISLAAAYAKSDQLTKDIKRSIESTTLKAEESARLKFVMPESRSRELIMSATELKEATIAQSAATTALASQIIEAPEDLASQAASITALAEKEEAPIELAARATAVTALAVRSTAVTPLAVQATAKLLMKPAERLLMLIQAADLVQESELEMDSNPAPFKRRRIF